MEFLNKYLNRLAVGNFLDKNLIFFLISDFSYSFYLHTDMNFFIDGVSADQLAGLIRYFID